MRLVDIPAFYINLNKDVNRKVSLKKTLINLI